MHVKGHTQGGGVHTVNTEWIRIGDTHGGGIYVVQTVWISKQKIKKMRSYTQGVFITTMG